MTDTQIDLTKFLNQVIKFQLVVNGEGPQVMEGTVIMVNGPAMILSPKGSTRNRLIELSDILVGSLEVVPIRPKELKPKQVLGTAASNVRQHLLDRHGYELAVINGITDVQAWKEHEEIDHDRLGHHHNKPETE